MKIMILKVKFFMQLFNSIDNFVIMSFYDEVYDKDWKLNYWSLPYDTVNTSIHFWDFVPSKKRFAIQYTAPNSKILDYDK